MPNTRFHVTCITTSRADYGLLKWPMRMLKDDPDIQLSIIAGGGHVAASQGATGSEVLKDGFTIDESVEMYLDTTSENGAAMGAGLSILGVAQALQRLKPDWVLLLGDRYEVLGAATAAALCKIPICHLCGGDVTEGAFDDALRHAISKLSHLHCPSTEDSAQRLLQMGEEPWRVTVTGSPGLDAIHEIENLPRAAVFEKLGLPGDGPSMLVTFHPTTLLPDLGLSELEALLNVLEQMLEVSIVFTGVNADTGGAEFNARLQAFAAKRSNAVYHQNLGQFLYMNTVQHVSMVVGNSSSGLYEIPSFGIPTVNIGDRQKGRLRAKSVFDCVGTSPAISAAITAAQSFSDSDVENPYGDGHSAARIVAALKHVSQTREHADILLKKFVTLGMEPAQ